MNIVCINHYAGSPLHGMEFRPYYLAREWVRAGHTVRMLAASYSHVRRSQPTVEGSAIELPTTENIDGIAYRWYPTPPYQGNGFGRVLNLWSFLRQVWSDTRRIVAECKPDVVIASSTYPMDIWVARRMARLANARLVFEVHDLWPMSPIELNGMSPRHPFILMCQNAEDFAYRHADVVVSMLPKVHEHMAAHGLDLRKLHIIPNGLSPDEWDGTGPAIGGALADHMDSVRARGRLVVGYTGSHGLPNALDVLLDAAALLRDEAFSFVLVGDGHEKERLNARITEMGLTNVRMFPPIPKPQIPAMLGQLDVAFIGWQNVPIYRFGIGPNKLIDYMMAGCAVLHSVNAGNDPVAEAGCGLTVQAESPQAVADGLRRLQALTRSEREAMGRNGRDHVMKHQTYPVLARRFMAILEHA